MRKKNKQKKTIRNKKISRKNSGSNIFWKKAPTKTKKQTLKFKQL